jgi:hypothetical protein
MADRSTAVDEPTDNSRKPLVPDQMQLVASWQEAPLAELYIDPHLPEGILIAPDDEGSGRCDWFRAIKLDLLRIGDPGAESIIWLGSAAAWSEDRKTLMRRRVADNVPGIDP